MLDLLSRELTLRLQDLVPQNVVEKGCRDRILIGAIRNNFPAKTRVVMMMSPSPDEWKTLKMHFLEKKIVSLLFHK